MKYKPLALLALLACNDCGSVGILQPDDYLNCRSYRYLCGSDHGMEHISGYTGYIALGHAVFFGTGAYALAILCKDWHVTSDYGPIPDAADLRANSPLSRSAARRNRATGAQSHVRRHHHRDVFHRATTRVYNLRDLTNGSAGLELPIPSWTFDCTTCLSTIAGWSFYYWHSQPRGGCVDRSMGWGCSRSATMRSARSD